MPGRHLVPAEKRWQALSRGGNFTLRLNMYEFLLLSTLRVPCRCQPAHWEAGRPPGVQTALQQPHSAKACAAEDHAQPGSRQHFPHYDHFRGGQGREGQVGGGQGCTQLRHNLRGRQRCIGIGLWALDSTHVKRGSTRNGHGIRRVIGPHLPRAADCVEEQVSCTGQGAAVALRHRLQVTKATSCGGHVPRHRVGKWEDTCCVDAGRMARVPFQPVRDPASQTQQAAGGSLATGASNGGCGAHRAWAKKHDIHSTVKFLAKVFKLGAGFLGISLVAGT